MCRLFRSMVLVSLLTVSSLVHADDKAIQKALAANYAKLDQAFQKNNVAAFSNMLSPDYSAIQPNGNKMTRAEMIANFKRERAALPGADMQSKITSITVKGNEAIATVQERLSGIMSDPRSKEHHNLVMIAESKDTWVKKDGVWKLKVYQMIDQTTTVDGKPLGGGGKAKHVGKVGK